MTLTKEQYTAHYLTPVRTPLLHPIQITTNERVNLQIEAAKLICAMGYNPSEAADVLKLPPASYEPLCKWYATWSTR